VAGNVVVRASDLQPLTNRLQVRVPVAPLHSGQVVHTRVPLFTKQYKLVPVKGW